MLFVRPLFGVDPQEDGNKYNECTQEGLSCERMAKHQAGNYDAENLSASHYDGEYDWAKRLYTVEYEELTCHWEYTHTDDIECQSRHL